MRYEAMSFLNVKLIQYADLQHKFDFFFFSFSFSFSSAENQLFYNFP